MWCGPGNRGRGCGSRWRIREKGLDEDKLEKIKRALKEGDGSGVGIGLGNIARRLKAMYEDDGSEDREPKGLRDGGTAGVYTGKL